MFQMLRRIFNAICDTRFVTHGTLPTSVDGVAAAAVTVTSLAAAWTTAALWTVIAASSGAVDLQIVGISLENFVGALSQGEVWIGTGALGAEVELLRIPTTDAIVKFEVGGPKIVAGTRVVAKYRTATGATDSVAVKLLTRIGA